MVVQVSQSISDLFRRLWRHISTRRRWQFALLLILMMMASIAEIFSIGAVVPFLAALSSPEKVYGYPLAKGALELIGVYSPDDLMLPLAIVFAVLTLAAGAFRLLLLWATTRLSFATGADLSISIYRRTLYQPYEVHISRNSSEVIAGISTKTNGVIYSALLPVLTVINAAIMLFAIVAVMLSVQPMVAVLGFGGFGLIYGCLIWFSRARKLINSQEIARESTQVIKSLQEGLGGIRDVLIDGSQEVYCQIYRKADLLLRQAQGNNQFISQSPRYGVEALGMLLIVGLAYYLSQQPDGIHEAIPTLGALALAAQRLLPIMQQAYASWSSIQGSQASLQDTLDLLDQPLLQYVSQPHSLPLPFSRQIKLVDLSFSYQKDNAPVLKGINLVIEKGSRIGIIGVTGSGKSTLVDIVMGLLMPTEGAIEVDSEPVTDANRRAWQAHIAHVPQSIFLADTTIEENIAFGVPKDRIDFERVRQAARQAQIADVIEGLPNQYHTFVGERGVRLSGGQRQRIGIARALYKQADFIIFDEATSALDSDTEESVMQAIERLSNKLTILIVAHRLTTLKNCTHIVELADGTVLRSGSYRQLFIKSP